MTLDVNTNAIQLSNALVDLVAQCLRLLMGMLLWPIGLILMPNYRFHRVLLLANILARRQQMNLTDRNRRRVHLLLFSFLQVGGCR